jgi:hypothetical protein
MTTKPISPMISSVAEGMSGFVDDDAARYVMVRSPPAGAVSA